MSPLRLALSLAMPVTPVRKETPKPQSKTRPQTLLELALPVPFFA
ncbi:MAG: hypothetical protein WCZ23_16790 [Rhodospirillaceae bacterium]